MDSHTEELFRTCLFYSFRPDTHGLRAYLYIGQTTVIVDLPKDFIFPYWEKYRMFNTRKRRVPVKVDLIT